MVGGRRAGRLTGHAGRVAGGWPADCPGGVHIMPRVHTARLQ